jgi:tRNA C32,U32 (ribose-2'-O)-methylase TrmJ
MEPENPENTGLVARLCKNFCADLAIVNPEFNLREAIKSSSKGEEKLRNTKIHTNLDSALKNQAHVIGTKPGRGIEASKAKIPENSSILIGRESNGLSNAELEMCDQVINIETGSYSSLNQSHAAAITMYMSYISDAKQKNKANPDLMEKFNKTVPETSRQLIKASAPTPQQIQRVIGEWKNRN